jgi:hypothetical protein
MVIIRHAQAQAHPSSCVSVAEISPLKVPFTRAGVEKMHVVGRRGHAR